MWIIVPRFPLKKACSEAALKGEFLVLLCARTNKTLPFLVGRLHKDPQAHAQIRGKDRAPDGSHFGDVRPECRIEMRRMQDVPHEPQDKIIATNGGQGHQEKAHSFTRFGRTFALERPISIDEETIERATSVGNRIEEQ